MNHEIVTQPEVTTELECIDIGANLTSKKFKNDLEKVLAESASAGLSHIVLTGSSEKNSVESSKICQRHPGFLYSTAGIHPHDASSYDPVRTTKTLEGLYELDHVVAVGECGLDFNRDFSPHDKQRDCFAAHLDLASKNRLPLFLHERDAFDTFYSMMKEARGRISRGVVHCFTGSLSNAKAYLDLDLHLGITGWICDERRGKHLREVVKEIPVNRLMIETDCPYLAPRDYRPRIKRNEPKYLPHILKTVAECRGESVDELAGAVLTTTKSFFDIQ